MQMMPEDIQQGNGVYRIDLATLTNEMYVVTVLVRNQEPISKRVIISR